MSRPATFKVDNTVYWVIRTYTDAGVLVDADSTPTVAIRKNGASVGDVATVTKRAATTGIYDCSWNPASEVEGDCFTVEETATVSAQAYENAWSIEALAAERGTDSSLLAADKPANFDLLAINVSGEVTTSNPASGGGSAHTAADVAALILSVPTTPLTNTVSGAIANVDLVATTTTNTDMRGTDGANTVTPNTVAPDNAGIAANNAAIAALNDLSASDVENAVWDATVSSHVVADSYGLRSIVALNSNRTIQITGSNHTAADVHEFQANALTSAATDASFVTEIQSGLSTFDSTTDQVVASNMRGTDGANTVVPNTVAPDNASISAILVDTADLQANQNNWLTATTTVSSNMRGTDNANTVTPVDVSGAIAALNDFNPAVDTVAHVTLVDTTTDLTNGGSGGGGTNPADIYTYFTDGTREDAFKADTSGLSTFDPSSDTVARVTLVDTTTDLTNQAAGGVGMFQASVRVEDSNGASLQGARVNVDGTTRSLTTGVDGVVVFNLDSGVYLLNLLPPAGYATPTGQVLTITSSDPAQTVFSLDSGGCGVPWIG